MLWCMILRILREWRDILPRVLMPVEDPASPPSKDVFREVRILEAAMTDYWSTTGQNCCSLRGLPSSWSRFMAPETLVTAWFWMGSSILPSLIFPTPGTWCVTESTTTMTRKFWFSEVVMVLFSTNFSRRNPSLSPWWILMKLSSEVAKNIWGRFLLWVMKQKIWILMQICMWGCLG